MHTKLGAVALVAVAVVAAATFGDHSVQAGGGCHRPLPAPLTDARGTQVDIGKCAFSPTVVRVDPGDTVEWVNQEDVAHMVTGAGGAWGDPQQYFRGDSVSFTFALGGVYPYFCELHPGMVGAVVVGDGSAASGSGVLNISAIRPASDGQTQTQAEAGPDNDMFGLPAAAAFIVAGVGAGIALAALGLSVVNSRRRRV